MDFDRQDTPGGPASPDSPQGPPQPPPYVPAPPVTPRFDPRYATGEPPRRKSGWRIFWGIFTVLSVIANVALLLLFVGAIALFATGSYRGTFTEQVIESGPRADKIVVIPIEGVIDAAQAQRVYEELKAARDDRAVKGLIVRIDSPGGTVSGSDEIYNEIRKFRREQGKPVVAFMQGMAASGGYYSSVACEKIIAEPTVITGSIGVIMEHFVLGELLEKKLGVQPVVIKSGEKKDWPSLFSAPTEEQLQYLRDRVITPALDRFLAVVAEGRKDVLTAEQIRPLADGGIYTAPQAKDNKLIDQIGYLDDAIAQVKSMAGLTKAQVVEYRQVFSLWSLLEAKSNLGIKLDRSTLLDLGMPQAMYLWRAY